MRFILPRSESCIHLALAATLTLSMVHGFEIIAGPFSHDDLWYQRKSLALSNDLANVGTIKELVTPLFMSLVSTIGLPLHLVYALLLVLTAHLGFLELRSWSWSRPAAWCASFGILIIPAQIIVLSRSTADPLAALMTLAVLIGSLAIVRTGAARAPILMTALAMTVGWLNRPEGILLALPALLAIALAWSCRTSDWARRNWVKRVTPFVLVPLGAWIAVSVYNESNYGFFAPTVLQAKPMQRALKAVMAIDDGATVQPYRFSVKAMELAAGASPSFARSKTWWDAELDGHGWGMDSPGAIDGGHFQWALLESSLVVGTHYRDRLAYLGAIAQELESAFAAGRLHRRMVLSPAVGPGFSLVSGRFFASLANIALPMVGGDGPINPVVDVGGRQWREVADRACNRRDWNTSPDVGATLGGYITLPALQVGPDWLGLELSTAELTPVARPDVVSNEFGRRDGSSLCGFSLVLPARNGDTTIPGSPETLSGNLLVGHTNGCERIPLAALENMPAGGVKAFGQVQVRIESVTAFVPERAIGPRRLQRLRTMGFALSRIAQVIFPAVAVVVGLVLMVPVGRRRLPQVAIVFTVLALAIIVPRWLLLSAIDSNMWACTEPRYLFPATVVIWAWCCGMIGAAGGIVAATVWRLIRTRSPRPSSATDTP